MLLIGFMGAGKSTVGRLVATRLAWEFIDLDEEIERAAGCSVVALFEREGEAGFRARESEATAALRGRSRIVVATGGGWMANGRIADVDRAGRTIWLGVSAAEAMRRAAATPGNRPLFGRTLDDVSALLAARSAQYAEADLKIETDSRDPEAIAAEIIEVLKAN